MVLFSLTQCYLAGQLGLSVCVGCGDKRRQVWYRGWEVLLGFT